jgi:hypothetical protein
VRLNIMGYQPTKPAGKQNPPQSISGMFTVEEVAKALATLTSATTAIIPVYTPRHPWNEKPEMLYADPEWSK